jgi:hypothetical protein
MKQVILLTVMVLVVATTAPGVKAAVQTITPDFKPTISLKQTPAFVPPNTIFFDEFQDERPNPEQVGENIENKSQRILVSTGDPQAVRRWVSRVLAAEFKKKGFQVLDRPAQADKILTGSIVQFWTVETTRYATETRLRFVVKDRLGKVYFDRELAGKAKNIGRRLSAAHYNEGFSNSLVMILDGLLIDRAFLQALAEKSAAPPPTPVEKPVQTEAPTGPAPSPGKSQKPASISTAVAVPEPLKTESSPPVAAKAIPGSITADSAAVSRAPVRPEIPPQPVETPANRPAVTAKTAPPSPPPPPARLREPPTTPIPSAAGPAKPAEPGKSESPQGSPAPRKPQQPQAEFIEHRVLPGETMATLAKYYSGNAVNWTKIAEENPGLHPFRLNRGEIVRVPKALATVHAEQPDQSTARDFYAPPGKTTSKPSVPEPAPPPIPVRPATPFGPK